MSIVFYWAPMSSASPVASALAELEVPHEVVQFDLTQTVHKRPEFLALNPNGKVPTIVVDGTPMFEALAILMWLGDRYGVDKGLWPAADAPERLVAMSWCTWAYVTYGTLLVRFSFSQSDRVERALHNRAQAEHAKQELDALLAILEARLSKQTYILGESYTLADLTVASVVGYGVFVGISVDRFPHVKGWLERFQARASYDVGIRGAA